MDFDVPALSIGATSLVKPSIADQAYKQLVQMIVTLRLPPGSTVAEIQLCNHLGIGRTPMREALQRLSHERTVKIVPRLGIIISEIDPVNQLKLLKVRRELEKVIACSAAQLADDDEKQHFLTLEAAFRSAGQNSDAMAFVHADGEFNALITEVAQNEYAKNAVSPLRTQSTRFWYLYFRKFGDLPSICHLHAEVASAVARNDETRAGQASDELMNYVDTYTRSTLPSWSA